MNRQKQIEEMAKAIFEYVDSKDLNKVYILHSGIAEHMKTYYHNYGVAKELYNAGYRKIPEGMEVVDRRVFENLQKYEERIREKAKFYYEKCKSYGIENFYDTELEYLVD